MRRTLLAGSVVNTSLVLLLLGSATWPGGDSGDVQAQVQTSPAGGQAEPLFTQATGAARAPRSDMDAHALRRAPIALSEKVLAAGTILTAEAHILNLFPDVQILAMRSRVESRSRTAYSWFGYTAGDEHGRAIITVNNGKVAAAVTYNGRSYVILPAADGRHDVFELDARTLQEGDDVDRVPPADAGMRSPALTRTSTLQATPLDYGGLVRIVGWDLVASNYGDLKIIRTPDDGTTIDVMVVYTHLAAEYSDWSHSYLGHQLPYALAVRIQLGIDIANQSFVDSGLALRLNVIGDPYEDPSYQEEGVAYLDLNAVRTGHLAGVHEEREYRAADLVMLVTATAVRAPGAESLCGKSTWVRPETVSDEAQAGRYGYFLVKSSCLSGFTTAHEVGHQLGAAHDWYTLSLQNGPGNEAPYSHGYAWSNPWGTRGFYTIMAYDWFCRDYIWGYANGNQACSRVGRWSDPNETHDEFGVPLGKSELLPNPAHDAKTVRLNRRAVANYRWSGCRATTGC
jgi:hypothetical protein